MPNRPLTQFEKMYGADLEGEWPKLQSEEQAVKLRDLNKNGSFMDWIKFYIGGAK